MTCLVHRFFEGTVISAVDGDWLRAGVEKLIAELAFVLPSLEVDQGCDVFVLIQLHFLCSLTMRFWDCLLIVRPVDAHILEVLFQARCPLIDVKGFFWRPELDLVIDYFSSRKLLEFKDDSFLYRSVEVQDLQQPVFGIAHFHVFQSQIALNDVQWQLPQLRIGSVDDCPILVDKPLILQSLYFLSVDP